MGPQQKGRESLQKGEYILVRPSSSRDLCLSLRSNHYLCRVGDAAHSFPPTGGLGLNCGIADAHNLVYKIAAVHHGWATSSILQTYEDDRRQIALVNSAQSVKNGKKIFSFLKALGTAGIDDVEEARSNLQKSIHDPDRQDMIATEVEGQREHFDNVSNQYPVMSERAADMVYSSGFILAMSMETKRRHRTRLNSLLSLSPAAGYHTHGSSHDSAEYRPRFPLWTCLTSKSSVNMMLMPVSSRLWILLTLTALP